ncbi:hypothetical protein CDAR_119241 [Caerostris darwini]|uniref:Uncharacterized protein n=1 Tax=Caerostris darwini TaxID=1538125 RepID=A0AAV4RTB6_9ARAC|nr:hypothetical protein CDAR_119241 [Caerostris darwini]
MHPISCKTPNWQEKLHPWFKVSIYSKYLDSSFPAEPDAANYLCKGRSSFQSFIKYECNVTIALRHKNSWRNDQKGLSSAEILGTTAASGICVCLPGVRLWKCQSKLIFGNIFFTPSAFRT